MTRTFSSVPGELFKQYYASCFWHMKPDLPITEAMLPIIIKGLRLTAAAAVFWRRINFLQTALPSTVRASSSNGVTIRPFAFSRSNPTRSSVTAYIPPILRQTRCWHWRGDSEIRDLIDILYLHETYLSLGAICWAACGKDPGFTPFSLLDSAKRLAKFREADLAAEQLRQPISLGELKQAWLNAAAQAEDLFARLPAPEVGCLYLSPASQPVSPDPASADFATLVRHFGSIRGAWPIFC